MTNEIITNTFNELISVCKDNVEGCAQASQQLASDDPLQPLLSELSERWQKISEALRAEIIYQEGVPTESGTLVGEVQRLYTRVKAVLSADERSIILDELEQLSSRALAKFEEALNQNLPAQARSIVQLQQGQVSAAYGRLRTLRKT